MRLLLFLLLLFSITARATSDGAPIIRNFESHDYQGGSRIYSVVSTSNGLLYAGDKNGVLIYDGETWQKVECGFSVMSMAVDEKEIVYVAGNKGIGFLETDSANVFNYIPLNHFLSDEGSFKQSRMSKVFNIEGNIVFVLGNQILINTPESLRIIESPYQFIYYQKLNDELYLYSSRNGLFKLNGSKIEIVSDDNSMLNLDVKGLINHGGSVYVVDNRSGVRALNEGQTHPNKITLDVIINANNIRGVEQFDDTTFVIKTFYNGFYILNSSNDIIKRYNYSNGLINNTIYDTFKDSWGILWVGTGAGISSIKLDFPFTIFNTLDGIGTGYSSIVFKDKIYLATSQGLYRKDTGKDGGLLFTKLFDGHVWSLHVVNDKLYFGHASGIQLFDGLGIERISYVPGGWSLKKIPDSKNSYLTSTPIGLLLLKLTNNNSLQEISFIKGLQKFIKNFEFDSNYTIWAETDNGICSLNLNEDYTEALNVRYFDRVESGNNLKKVRKINNKINFIADNGVYSFDPQISDFMRDGMFDGLVKSNGNITNLIYDKYGKIWAFIDEDIYRFQISDGKLKRISPKGFDFANKSYPLDYENICYIDDHLVLIGQEQGFLCSDLNLFRLGTYSAAVIREIRISLKGGAIQNVWGNEQFNNHMQTLQLEDKLSYENNSIKFYFSAGSSNYGNVKYSTFLIGFDDSWTEWNQENIKEYTNLSPGDYQFLVRSVNESNEFSYVAKCQFTIMPPWYLSSIAKGFYVIILVILVFGIERLIRYRAKRMQERLLRKQEDQQFRKGQKQIQENLRKEKELVKLRNDQLRIDNLYKSKELANSTMSIIQKNQFLTDLKQELLKIREFSEKNKVVTEDVSKLIRKVNRDIENEENWNVFENYFDSVHENFFNKMKQKHPILTSKDLRLCAYLRMNLSTKEIAPLMNITVRGVEIGRYRLRKKLGIGRTDSLNDFLFNI